MLYERKIEDLMQAVAPLVPRYEINAVDINEALDYGVGNCAVRCYIVGALLKDQIPRDHINVKFGYTEDEHGLRYGKRIYGHAALSLWVAGEQTIVDTDTRSQAFLDQDTSSFPYEWYDLSVGYRKYLDELDRNDVRFNRHDIVRVIKKQTGIK
jgi:hypothetical protein